MKNDPTDYCARLRFAWDMNLDGAITISDYGLLLKQMVLLPASVVMVFLEAVPSWHAFFEATCETGRGAGGWVFSALLWFAVLSVIAEKRS